MRTINITIENITFTSTEETKTNPFAALLATLQFHHADGTPADVEDEDTPDTEQTDERAEPVQERSEMTAQQASKIIVEFLADEDDGYSLRTYPAIKKALSECSDGEIQAGLMFAQANGQIETRTRRIDGARLYKVAD